MIGTTTKSARLTVSRLAPVLALSLAVFAAPGSASANAPGIDPNAAIPIPRANPGNPDGAPVSNPQELLANISQYFNRVRSMQGEFIQFGPNGEQSEGVFFIQRPGKLRFHYRPPVAVDVIADGRSVSVQDKRVGTQDLYPLSQTPLRHLLANNIDLAASNIVSDVVSEPDLVALVIEEKRALADGQLTLIFDNQTYELRQWIVTDAQGLETSVAVFNVETGLPADPGLFNIYVSRDSLGNRN